MTCALTLGPGQGPRKGAADH
ncbi:hypothetical protein RV134_190077 [Roseovarius sp. EC-HK134]|nr:hypothetical protein RV134_190077 [Roseovarius sp. EC-HK134]